MKIKCWIAALLCVLLIGSLFPVSALAAYESEGNRASVEAVEETAAPEPRQETESEPQTDKTASLATPSDAMPMSAFADDIASGTGWNLDADGVLHITGDISESGFNLTSEQRLQVKSVVAESGASISSGYSLFYEFRSMVSADLSLLNTTGVTNIRNMFSGCRSLTSLNLSSFDTSSVTDMRSMFEGCSSLTSLNLSSFDTSSVTTMGYMFYGCSSLTFLNLSSFDTSSVTTMEGMFEGCSSLTYLDVSGFRTNSVTDMIGMFSDCSSLTSLNLSSFDTSSVTSMSCMFWGCSSLTSLDVSGFKTYSLMYAEEMFRGCSALTSLGIRPDILSENADDIIAIRSPWQKQGSTDTYSTADELKAVTDTVTLLAMYTVNVQNDGNGTASANPDVAAKDETVTLTATPDTGYHFKEWQSSDVTVNNNSFTMPKKDVTVKAIFEADALTYTGGGGGSSYSESSSAVSGQTYSPNWFCDGQGVWRIRNRAGQIVTNAWLCDDVIKANGQNVWYLLGQDGTMVSAGLVQDNTGNFYSLEAEHNGYFGMLRYQNGTYNCNGQQVYLTFNQEHNGSFGAITNAEGLEKLKAIYGVTQNRIGNENAVYTAAF